MTPRRIDPLPVGWFLLQQWPGATTKDLAAAALVIAADTIQPHPIDVDPIEQQHRWGLRIGLEPLYQQLHLHSPFIFGVAGQWTCSVPDLLLGRNDSDPATRRRVAGLVGLPWPPPPHRGTPADWEHVGDRAQHIVTTWQPGHSPEILASWTLARSP